MWFVLVLLVCALNGVRTQEDFLVPDAKVEVFSPKGLRVSIPASEGMSIFAFHGKINEEMNGREAGTYSRDILKAVDGRWTFWEPNAKLKVGDILYYWTYVEIDDGEKRGYANDDQLFVVKELLPLSNKATTSKRTTTTPKPPKSPKTMATTTTTTTTTKKPPTQSTGFPTNCAVFSTTTVNGKQVCKGQLLFEDNFSSLDMKLWKPDIKIAGPPDYEFVIYNNYPENLSVKNGNLYIKPTLCTNKFGEDFITGQYNLGRNCTGTPGSTDCSREASSFLILPPIFSSRIKTKDLSFTYGRVEIRAKTPKGSWIYPEFFLEPKNYEYGKQYDSGQMRVAFVPGNDRLGLGLNGGIILGSSEEARSYGMRYSQSDDTPWYDAFHTYVLKWKPDEISLSVDGTPYGSIKPPEGGFASEGTNLLTSAGARWVDGSPMAPFDKEMTLSVGVGVGGHNFADTVIGGKPWKNKNPKNMLNFWLAKDSWFNTWGADSQLRVDYVKISAL